MARKPKTSDALAELLSAASHQILSKLITRLATESPDFRRECFDFLNAHVSVSEALVQRSEGEAVLALWFELAPDLEDLDMYGGGDDATEDHVTELLNQIRERLESRKVDADSRHEILELTLPYIENGNAGMDDMLYDVAYATCYDDDDLRSLAQYFEAMNSEWKTDHARRSMHRKEYDEAVAILTGGRYPMSSWGGEYQTQVAQEFDNRYPEEILKYYLSGLGNLDRNADRKEYTRKAKVMVKVRHVLVDVVGDVARWDKFARQVKRDNLRRPAFQQEFTLVVPGWRELNG